MGNDGDNLDRPAPVTREEYDALVKRIAALEGKLNPAEKRGMPEAEVRKLIRQLDGPPGAQ